MSLDDIWSEPLAEEPINRGRRKDPLFLPDDSDGETSGIQNDRQDSPPTQQSPLETGDKERPEGGINSDKAKLDAIFNDVDDEDIFAGIDKPIDLEGMRRRAQAKIAATQPSAMTTDRTVDDSQSASKKDGPTQRHPVSKLDEERLLGLDGFPRLLKEYKNFKVSGKGREAQDLERLFRIYHEWTHRLFPKYKFHDTVERVEKLCRSRRMTVNLRAWRDDAHGITRSQQTEDDAESGSESEGNRINANGIRSSSPAAQSKASSPPGSPANPSRSGSIAPSVPSSQTDMGDMDALMREEEELMQELNGGNSVTPKQYRTAEDDDEALWATAEGASVVPQIEQAHYSKSLEDDYLWDMVDEIQKSSSQQNELSVLSKSPLHPVLTTQVELPTLGGEWDDMYE